MRFSQVLFLLILHLNLTTKASPNPLAFGYWAKKDYPNCTMKMQNGPTEYASGIPDTFTGLNSTPEALGWKIMNLTMVCPAHSWPRGSVATFTNQVSCQKQITQGNSLREVNFSFSSCTGVNGQNFSANILGATGINHPAATNLKLNSPLTSDTVVATATSTPPVALTARSLMFVFWTGSEMIIWGGNDQGSPVNTGARYNPTTDTWKSISQVNAPQALGASSAVWTGSEMIVWGGYNSVSGLTFNTGARYNPTTDTWTALTTTSAPTARYRHTAVWTGTEMIIWGGISGNGQASVGNTGARYNPTTDTWAAISHPATTVIPDGRYNHTAVWTGTKMIIWGGGDGNSSYNSTGAVFNLSTQTWTATPISNQPVGRQGHTAVWTGTEMIVWGGSLSTGLTTNTGGKYYPDTNTWTATSLIGSMIAASGHSVVWIGNKMIVWGGSTNTTPFKTASGYSYVPGIQSSAGTWTIQSGLAAQTPRANHGMVWTGVEVIVWGGSTNTTPFQTDKGFRFK